MAQLLVTKQATRQALPKAVAAEATMKWGAGPKNFNHCKTLVTVATHYK